MNKEKDKFEVLKNKVLSNKTETKKQKIIQASESVLKEEEPFTFWLPKSKMKALKMLSIESGSNLKTLLNEGVDLVLKKNSNL